MKWWWLGPAAFVLLLVLTAVICGIAVMAPAGPEPGLVP